MDRTPPGRASSTSDDRARATGRNRTLLTRYQGLAKAPDYVAALFADISMRSAVALTQAAKADDAATRAFVANTAAEDMTVLACERFAREIGGKESTSKPEAAPVGGVAPPTPASTPEPSPARRSAQSIVRKKLGRTGRTLG